MNNFLRLTLACMILNFCSLNAVEYTVRHSEFDCYQRGEKAFYTTLKQYLNKERKFDISAEDEYLTLEIKGEPEFKKSIKHGIFESLFVHQSLMDIKMDNPKPALKRTKRFTTKEATTTLEECLQNLQNADKSNFLWVDFFKEPDKKSGSIVLGKAVGNIVFQMKIPVIIQD
ncbi:hypothetical protein Bealeia1_01910 [Candidatus Bealeia paramacronuclearis]|uniref:Uncharacterized protein n=1 Tax=Candidatus Bealeia paramacronuclearis TaxID=1921001 RepID=A0ABZ2CBI5_9PROT|nr:hypothetical protein [Candidatus Bealeia paramacronuclearis]